MQQGVRATNVTPPERKGRKALSALLSDSSEQSIAPPRLVPGGAARGGGGVNDHDHETSSYASSETSDGSLSDNSEEYVPLAFGYIKSTTRRRAGAPAPLHVPSGVSEEADEKESLSLSDAPLEVVVQHERTKRRCGKGVKDLSNTVVTSTLSYHDEEDTVSSAMSTSLLVEIQHHTRPRVVGRVRASTYEVSETELSTSLTDKDEAPLNAQLIHTLIKRLRHSADVPLEAFDFVDFDDKKFKAELAPLKKIQALLAERASNPIVASAKRDRKIKEAVQSLAPIEAVVAKAKVVKSRQIRSSQRQNRLHRGGESELEKAEVIAKLVHELQDPNAAVQLRAFEEVDWNDRNFDPVLTRLQQIRAYMEAKEVALAKPVEGEPDNVAELDAKIQTFIRALPSEAAMAATVDAVKDCSMANDPSNGDAILSLVARLKESGQTVPKSEFDKLDWNDPNFRRELEPLQQIRAFVEAKEMLQQQPNENVLEGLPSLDEKIKTAILSLPSEKAMVAKVATVRSRVIKATQGKERTALGGEAAAENAQAIAKLVRELQDPNAAVQLCAFDEVNWNDRNFDLVLARLQQIRAYMEVKEEALATHPEGEIGDVAALDAKIQTFIRALPSEAAMAATVDAVKDRSMSNGVSNGDAILGLVARLKESGQTVPKSEFDKLDWNDPNFRRELEPLQQIRAFVEAKEMLQQQPNQDVARRELVLDTNIKLAILSLPSEKAIAVKTQMIKMRQAPTGAADHRHAVKVATMSAPATKKKKLTDSLIMSNSKKKSRAKECSLSASNSQVMQLEVRAICAQEPKYKTRESTALSGAPKKVRRTRSALGRSVSFSNIEDAPPGEIIEKDQELANTTGPQPLLDGPPTTEPIPTPQRTSRVPSRPAGVSKPEQRPHSQLQNSDVSFGSIPAVVSGVVREEEAQPASTKRKPARRRGPSRLGRSISMTSLPDMEVGELVEEPTLAASKPVTPSPARSVTPAATGKLRRLRPSRPNSSTRFDQRPEEALAESGDGVSTLRNAAAPNPERKKRRVKVGNNNNRSCSFLEVGDVEAQEILENEAQLKGTGLDGEAARPKKGKMVLCRRRPGSAGPGRALELSNLDMAEAGEAHETAPGNQAPMKRRRSNVQRPRSTSASTIVDAEAGEVVEKPDELSGLYSWSSAVTPSLDEMSTTRANGSGAPPKSPQPLQGPGDSGTTGRRRRQRMHMSKELSISAIPDNLVGEIVENAPTSLPSSVHGLPPLVNGRTSRQLPRAGGGGGERLVTGQGQPVSNMPVRTHREGRRDLTAPRMDAGGKADPLPNATVKPSPTPRPPAESVPRSGASAAAKSTATGNQRMPPVRASS